jgi:antitoxin component of MazEF toxin-antitoxin module/predicted nucleic acid-binding protein
MELKLSKWGNSLALRLPSSVTKSLHLEDGDILEINVNKLREIVLTPIDAFDKADFLQKLQEMHGSNISYNPANIKMQSALSGMIYVDSSVIVSMLSNQANTQICIDWFSTLEAIAISGECLIAEFNSAIALMHSNGQLSERKIKLILPLFEKLICGGIKLLPVNREVFKKASELIQNEPTIPVRTSLHLGLALVSDANKFVTLDTKQYAFACKLGLNGILLA